MPLKSTSIPVSADIYRTCLLQTSSMNYVYICFCEASASGNPFLFICSIFLHRHFVLSDGIEIVSSYCFSVSCGVIPCSIFLPWFRADLLSEEPAFTELNYPWWIWILVQGCCRAKCPWIKLSGHCHACLLAEINEEGQHIINSVRCWWEFVRFGEN